MFCKHKKKINSIALAPVLGRVKPDGSIQIDGFHVGQTLYQVKSKLIYCKKCIRCGQSFHEKYT